MHLANDYPKLMLGILLAAEEMLKEDFDVEAFMGTREKNPERFSSFYGIASV